MALTIQQAIDLATDVGFSGQGLVTMVCIALAESGLNPGATNTQNNTPPSEDRGILQINSYWHPEVNDTCAFDAGCAFLEGYRISKNGTDFTAWTTFESGAWEKYQIAVKNILKPPPVVIPPTPAPPTPIPTPPTPRALVLSSKGTVCDIMQSNQLNTKYGSSQDRCGPWTASELRCAGRPNTGGSGATLDDLMWWAHNEYTKYIGPDVASDQNGSSIDNMHQFFHDAGNLHYWDIAAINANSSQASDLAHLRAAVKAGYPVAMTVAEQSVISKRTGKCPYPWQPRLGNVTHIFALIGIDEDGDLIVADELNSFEAWYPVYKAGPIDCSWASVIQLVGPDATTPWLAPIPSDDPTSWPQGFNAQLFAAGESGGTHVDNIAKQAALYWSITTQGSVKAGGNALAEVGIFPAGKMPYYSTGIAQSWEQQLRAGHNYGPPTSYEFNAFNWQGKPVVAQFFQGGWCEWDGSAHWYQWAING